MNENKLIRGQNLLLLRYSPSIRKDIIEQHQAIISELGYCWYGKLSGVTSDRIIHAITKTSCPMIMLYSKGKAFLCEFIEMTTEKPKNGYPEYYDTEYIYPNCYFKLKSIDPIDLELLSHFYVRSSKRNLSEVFSKQCMSSSLFVAYEEILDLPTYVKPKDASVKHTLGKDECRYMKQGNCTLSNCINYGYKCERPSTCKKQKR